MGLMRSWDEIEKYLIVFETEDYWITVPVPALQSLISKKTVKQYTEYPTLS